jgi:hypothetical protein
MPICSFGGAKCPDGPGAAGSIEDVREHERVYHAKFLPNRPKAKPNFTLTEVHKSHTGVERGEEMRSKRKLLSAMPKVVRESLHRRKEANNRRKP